MPEELTPAQAHERALALHMAGALDQAEAIYRQILQAAPKFGPTWMTLGVLLGQEGKYVESEALLREASRLMPNSADAWSNLGNVLRILERNLDSAEACQRAVELNPSHAFAWSNLSAAWRLEGRVQEALGAARKALALSPDYVEARVNEGCALQSMGRMEEAVAAFENLTEACPQSLYGWSCCLLAIQYSDRHTQEDIWKRTLSFFKVQEEVPRPSWSGRAKRIGLLSGDFCEHAVGEFILPLVENWDSSRHQLHLFSALAGEDKVTRRLKEAAGKWHDISGLSDPDAAALMKSERIDLLIDLSGHTAKNRMSLVMMRPAAFIASYLGFSASSGLRAVDVVIGDPWVTPPEHDRFYTEKVIRLETSVFCRVLPSAPRRSGGPKGRLGSFNNPAKISPSCLDLWAELMKREPEAALVLKYRGFDDEEVRSSFAGEMRRRGVDEERLEFHGWMAKEDHRALIAGLDLHLDTQPYTGATTLVDMLEAGVPCPTIAGDRYAARMGASVLAAAGIPELICQTPEEWLEACQRLLHDEDFRQGIQEKMAQAPLSAFCDAKGFARSFQNLCDQIPQSVLALEGSRRL